MNCIQEKRLKANMTQAEMARRLELDRSTIAKWETGKANPRAEVLVKLARILGCTIDQLIVEKQK